MGANIVRRVVKDGHECVVYDHNADAVEAMAGDDKITGVSSLSELTENLDTPRVVWVMVPAGEITTGVIEELAKTLDKGDIVIDGGNSYYRDDISHAKTLSDKGLHLLDCGTSGGVWGRERGYCLMIGGDSDAFGHAEPVFASVAPGVDAAPRTPGRDGEVGQAEKGYLHCGPSGAGHFVKMVHNGIEYGMMASLAEGLNILDNADIGKKVQQGDAETAPMTDPEFYQYDIDIPAVTEVWRRGSVIGSWLLDLTAIALQESPALKEFAGRVSDSGEGRWTSIAAIDEGVPAPVLTTALQSRFASRDLGDFANKALSAMRKQFGGHDEKSG
jgi:6-phosphogluconate dehydrogenase